MFIRFYAAAVQVFSGFLLFIYAMTLVSVSFVQRAHESLMLLEIFSLSMYHRRWTLFVAILLQNFDL